MKILHLVINYYPSIGGTQILFKGISENCIKTYKDEVEVITIDSYFGSHSAQYKEILLKNEIINGVLVKRFSFFKKHKNVFSFFNKIIAKLTGNTSPFLTRYLVGPWSPSLKRAVDTTDADIISASPSSFLYMEYPLYRHKLKNPKPFVYQGAIHFANHQGKQVVSSKTLEAIKASEYYMCNTEYEKKMLATLGVPAEMIVVTGTAVDIELFANGNRNTFREENNINNDEILIGYIGRLEATKSIDILVDAFIKALKQNNKLRLVIAGYESAYLEQLRNYIQTLDSKYTKFIYFKLNLETVDKINIYHSLDIFILPSINESFGIVFLEAWSCKKPVIGTDIGAIASVINDGVDGLLMKPNNIDSLAEKIILFAENDQMRQEFGNNGYEKTKNNFTWEIVTKKYRDTYQLAIDKFKSKLK